MTTYPLSDHRDVAHPAPGLELRWPASAIWRPGEPEVRAIGLADLRDAIARGFEDFMAMPTHAIFLCVIYPIIGLLLARIAFGYDLLPLVFPMIAGFALVGPFAAIGLYELSRRREQGLEVSALDAVDVLHSPSFGAILKLGVVLVAIFAAWLYAAQAIYTQMMGAAVLASPSAFLDQVTSTAAGHKLMFAGNLVGFAFAVVVLVISAVSFPMLVDRNVSAATAVRTSVKAAIENPVVIAVWGLIVAVSLLLGALPFFLGLPVVLPVLGHATWHLYRKVVVE